MNAIDCVNSFSFFFMILAQNFRSRSLMQFYTKLAPKETSLLQIGFRYIHSVEIAEIYSYFFLQKYCEINEVGAKFIL